MKNVSSLFLLSGYFVQLCMDVCITVYDFQKMSLDTTYYVVLEHFYQFDLIKDGMCM